MDSNETEHARARTETRDIRLLLVGALAGLAIAAYGILDRDDPGVPADAVAVVNGVIISRAQTERALNRATNGPDRSADDVARVVEQLIDEELLLQRGIELGMTNSDAAVRAAIVNSLVASVTAEADAANPDDSELAAHLAANSERFSSVSGLSLDAWQSDEEEAAQDFAAALRLSADAPATVARRTDIPARLLPLEELRDLLGPGIAASAAGMPPGSVAVFARRGAWVVIRVNDIATTTVSDLASVRNRVLLDYRRHLADRRLRAYLDDLRRRAEIRMDSQ